MSGEKSEPSSNMSQDQKLNFDDLVTGGVAPVGPFEFGSTGKEWQEREIAQHGGANSLQYKDVTKLVEFDFASSGFHVNARLKVRRLHLIEFVRQTKCVYTRDKTHYVEMSFSYDAMRLRCYSGTCFYEQVVSLVEPVAQIKPGELATFVVILPDLEASANAIDEHATFTIQQGNKPILVESTMFQRPLGVFQNNYFHRFDRRAVGAFRPELARPAEPFKMTQALQDVKTFGEDKNNAKASSIAIDGDQITVERSTGTMRLQLYDKPRLKIKVARRFVEALCRFVPTLSYPAHLLISDKYICISDGKVSLGFEQTKADPPVWEDTYRIADAPISLTVDREKMLDIMVAICAVTKDQSSSFELRAKAAAEMDCRLSAQGMDGRRIKFFLEMAIHSWGEFYKKAGQFTVDLDPEAMRVALKICSAPNVELAFDPDQELCFLRSGEVSRECLFVLEASFQKQRQGSR